MSAVASFKIEKNVPLGPRSRSGGSSYPFAEMEVGDSFFIPVQRDVQKFRNGLSQSLSYQRLRYQRKFATRKVEGGIRVWRVQ